MILKSKQLDGLNITVSINVQTFYHFVPAIWTHKRDTSFALSDVYSVFEYLFVRLLKYRIEGWNHWISASRWSSLSVQRLHFQRSRYIPLADGSVAWFDTATNTMTSVDQKDPSIGKIEKWNSLSKWPQNA